MLETVLVVLVVLWIFGIVRVPGFSFPHYTLFSIAGHAITIANILTVLAIIWLINLLPSPFRQIAMILLLLYILSVLGFIAISGFGNLMLAALIVGGIVTLFQQR